MSFSEQVLRYLTLIPKGRVMTYGQLARAVGRPGASRAVGNILHRNPDPDRFPCFRIVNSRGMIAEHFGLGPDEQIRRLRADGIQVVNGRVDLEKYGIKGSLM